MYKLVTEREIDAAHFLPHYPGKCANLHGHRWKIKVEIASPVVNEWGFVVDFSLIKDAIDSFDHQLINDFLPEDVLPTAENIAKELFNIITMSISKKNEFAFIDKITVWETENNSIEYTGEE